MNKEFRKLIFFILGDLLSKQILESRKTITDFFII